MTKKPSQATLSLSMARTVLVSLVMRDVLKTYVLISKQICRLTLFSVLYYDREDDEVQSPNLQSDSVSEN